MRWAAVTGVARSLPVLTAPDLDTGVGGHRREATGRGQQLGLAGRDAGDRGRLVADLAVDPQRLARQVVGHRLPEPLGLGLPLDARVVVALVALPGGDLHLGLAHEDRPAQLLHHRARGAHLDLGRPAAEPVVGFEIGPPCDGLPAGFDQLDAPVGVDRRIDDAHRRGPARRLLGDDLEQGVVALPDAGAQLARLVPATTVVVEVLLALQRGEHHHGGLIRVHLPALRPAPTHLVDVDHAEQRADGRALRGRDRLHEDGGVDGDEQHDAVAHVVEEVGPFADRVRVLRPLLVVQPRARVVEQVERDLRGVVAFAGERDVVLVDLLGAAERGRVELAAVQRLLQLLLLALDPDARPLVHLDGDRGAREEVAGVAEDGGEQRGLADAARADHRDPERRGHAGTFSAAASATAWSSRTTRWTLAVAVAGPVRSSGHSSSR